ncbi:hypothetical protein [Prosthecobacter sp.]|uniref:hypothetical protein n=1 Tax=Prosthecobacter sp. TaxID=1965333 RepID=UPI0037844A52
MMKLLGLSCRQFAVLTSLRLDRPLSLTENLRFHLHSLLCHVCRPLPRQLENLRVILRCTACHEENTDILSALSPEALQHIREALKQEAGMP